MNRSDRILLALVIPICTVLAGVPLKSNAADACAHIHEMKKQDSSPWDAPPSELKRGEAILFNNDDFLNTVIMQSDDKKYFLIASDAPQDVYAFTKLSIQDAECKEIYSFEVFNAPWEGLKPPDDYHHMFSLQNDCNVAFRNEGLHFWFATDGRDENKAILNKCTKAQLTNDGRLVLIGESADEIWASAPKKSEPKTFKIGDKGPAGGFVFYVKPGSNGQHGLEAAPVDQTSAKWGCYGTVIEGADGTAIGTAIGTGAKNTAAILAGCLKRPIAASIADSYTLNGFSDWFLPSKAELNKLYLQMDDEGGFANVYYWSSSENGGNFAWYQFFDDGFQLGGAKGSKYGVRAVRAF